MRDPGLRVLVLVPGIKGRLRPEFVSLCLFLFHVVVFQPHLLRGQTDAPPAGVGTIGVRTIQGIVKSGNMPIPGARVSATNAATNEQLNTSTDVDGSYSLRVPADGRYTVCVQMAAFAAGSHEVVLDATHQDVQANFELVLLSRARETTAENNNNNKAQQRRANAAGRGFQSLSVFQSEAGQDSSGGSSGSSSGSSMADVAPEGMPVPGIAPTSATESVAVSGNTSNPFNAMSADEMQQRFNDARQQDGGFGGGGGFGGPGGGRGGGGFGGGGGVWGGGAGRGARGLAGGAGVWVGGEDLAGGALTPIVRTDRCITASAI